MKIRVYKNTNNDKLYGTKKGVLGLSDKKLRLHNLNITTNRLYNSSTCSLTGEKVIFREVVADVPQDAKATGLNILPSITVNKAGEYKAKDFKVDGWESVEVDLPKINPFEINKSPYNTELGISRVGDTRSTIYSRKALSIPEYTFYNRDDMAFDYIMDDNCLEINEHCFVNCTYLYSVRLSSNIKYIARNCFTGCDNLKFNVYKNGKYLGNEANPYLALISVVDVNETLTLHDNTKCIAVDALDDWINATNLNEYENGLYVPSDSNPYFALIDFDGDNLSAINVHANTVLIVNANTNNANHIDLVIPNNVISVIDSFNNILNINKLTLGEKVSYIKAAFMLNGISEIKIASNNKYLKLSNGVVVQPGDTVCLSVTSDKIVVPNNIGRLQSYGIYIPENKRTNTIIELPANLEVAEEYSIYQEPSSERISLIVNLPIKLDIANQFSFNMNEYILLAKGGSIQQYDNFITTEPYTKWTTGYASVVLYYLENTNLYSQFEQIGYRREELQWVDEKYYDIYVKDKNVFYWRYNSQGEPVLLLRESGTNNIREFPIF